LGDNKIIKDFHREFLNKRIELRPRVQQPRKDVCFIFEKVYPGKIL